MVDCYTKGITIIIMKFMIVTVLCISLHNYISNYLEKSYYFLAENDKFYDFSNRKEGVLI